MKLIKIKKDDFAKYLNLEKSFVAYNRSVKVDDIYGLKKPEDLDVSKLEDKFNKRMEKDDNFFYFAEIEGKIAGYIYGYIESTGDNFDVKRNGYLSSIFVEHDFRGKGLASLMKKEFFKWLKDNDINLCQIHVASKNIKTLEIYKDWGFEIDELRLVKKI